MHTQTNTQPMKTCKRVKSIVGTHITINNEERRNSR